MPTQVILLQRIEKLGKMGDVVAVKPGYARNYLLPQHKALRASKQNIALFEEQKKHLEAENDKRRKDSEKSSKKVEGAKIAIIRQASESGQLYGSVSTRDIAVAASEATGVKIERTMVRLNTAFKSIGLFPVSIALHPEVTVSITINIARSEDEAEIQAKTGKALIAEDARAERENAAEKASALAVEAEALLEESALEALKTEGAEVQPSSEEAAAEEKPKKARRAKASEE